MIITDRTITVKKGVSTIDEPVILYRGDYDVKVRFVIKNSRFLFLLETTQLETNNASYAQLAIIKPDGDNVFSDISTCEEGAVSFTLTSDMIDELHEVGLYSFQIRLYDKDQQARASIPPVEYGIEIREPIASEDHTNAVDEALVGYSIAKTTSIDNEPVGPTFDDAGEYNVTQWETGDRITEGKLNKIEDALDTLNQNDKSLDRRIVNNYNALTNSFQELSDGVTADIQEMNDTIGANFQEMNDTIDTNFQEMNDTVTTNFQEIRDEITTSVSQLEYDINNTYATKTELQKSVGHNLIKNSMFPDHHTHQWWFWGGTYQWTDWNYYKKEGDMWLANRTLFSESYGNPGGMWCKPFEIEEGETYTLSFYCEWEPKVHHWSFYCEFLDEEKETLSTLEFGKEFFESDITKRQSATFTPPPGSVYFQGGFYHTGSLDETGSAILLHINSPCIRKGYSKEWTPSVSYTPTSGDWFNGGKPFVNPDGGMEIGRYIDFHSIAENTTDHTARIASESDGHINMYAWFHPGEDNKYDIGGTSKRWRYINLVNNPTVSSDRTLKENISYIKNEKAKSAPTDEIITYEDMYNFVKDDLQLATYNFKGQEEQSMNFIAQDLLYNLDGTDNKIGQMIINPVAPPTEEEIAEAKSNMDEDQEYTYPTLSYDMGMYISVLAGALKTALNKIDALEEQIASITQQQE